jgi:ankyrin repeat protein
MRSLASVTWYSTFQVEFLSTPTDEYEQLFTGQAPFHDLSPYLAAFHVSEGKRPHRPTSDQNIVILPNDDEWTLIELCWRQDPTERPTMGFAAAQLHIVAEVRNTGLLGTSPSVPTPVSTDVNMLLFMCAVQGWVEDVQTLLAEGAGGSFRGHYAILKRTASEGPLSDSTEGPDHELNISRAASTDTDCANKTDSILFSLLHVAVLHGHVDLTKLLLGGSVDVNAQDAKGWTPLHWAVFRRDTELVLLLLQHKAHPSALDSDGNTALHMATHVSETTIMTALITEYPSLIHTSNASGETPLHLACERGSYDVAMLLLDRGASVMDKTNQGRTSLECVFASHPTPTDLASNRTTRIELFRKILSVGGANLTRYLANQGRNVLHLAALYGDCELAQTLFDMSTPLVDPDKYGMTPFHLACLKGHIEFLELLIQHSLLVDHHVSGPSPPMPAPKRMIDDSDRYGWTPLHWVAYCGLPRIVRILLREQVRADQMDINGWTPLHCVAAGSVSYMNIDATNAGRGKGAGWQAYMQATTAKSQEGYVELARLLPAERRGPSPLSVLHHFNKGSSSGTKKESVAGLLTINSPTKEQKNMKLNPIKAIKQISSAFRTTAGCINLRKARRG